MSGAAQQPEAVSSQYEISAAPGPSWSGRMVHAQPPDAVRLRFLGGFCVMQ